MKILLTGSAGFIGSHVARRLLERGDQVVGIDNLNAYYDVDLKRARLHRLQDHPGYRHVHASLEDRTAIVDAFAGCEPDRVINLAAQAGVRYSLENPWAYTDSNVLGFLNILECCREHRVGHLVFASSSSVYGANSSMPHSERRGADHPLTLYAATKKAGEMMAHSYSYLHAMPTTGLRFFTVYGPWGRPDMVMFLFARAILAGEPIKLFNHGQHSRSFTYIDDIVDGVIRVLDQPPSPDPSWRADSPDPASSLAPYRLFNLGNERTVPLTEVVGLLERSLGRKARVELMPLQRGDVADTSASMDNFHESFASRPLVSIEDGIARFVDWYRGYYGG